MLPQQVFYDWFMYVYYWFAIFLIAAEIAGGLPSRYESCNSGHDKNCIELRDQNRCVNVPLKEEKCIPFPNYKAFTDFAFPLLLGKMLNIKDAYSHPLFYKGLDEKTGFRTR